MWRALNRVLVRRIGKAVHLAVIRLRKRKWKDETVMRVRTRGPQDKITLILWLMFERRRVAQRKNIAAARRLRRHKHGWR